MAENGQHARSGVNPPSDQGTQRADSELADSIRFATAPTVPSTDKSVSLDADSKGNDVSMKEAGDTGSKGKGEAVNHTAIDMTVEDFPSLVDSSSSQGASGAERETLAKTGAAYSDVGMTKLKSVDQENKKFACCPCSRAVACTAVVIMVLVYLLALGLGLGVGLGAKEEIEGGPWVKADGGVAADHTACSEVGRDILAKGGSAVDSSIATLLCVGVRQPHSMGIGGGVFLAVYDKKTGSVDMYDGREVAPKAATYEVYLNKSFLFGSLSIAVPGEVMAYWQAHKKHGHLPWKELFTPTIRMAASGHPLSYSTARALKVLRDNFQVTLSDYPELCKMFCKADGKTAKEQGDEVKMPTLARTLQGLADHGPDYLYSSSSPAAQELIKDVKDMGGLMRLEDLEDYKVVMDPPVSTQLGDLTMHTLTAPSGGPVLSLITKILHGLKLSPADLHNVTTEGAMWHKVVEAFKFVYADRLKLGDPAFVNITQLLNKMASSEYAQKLVEAIDPTRTYSSEHYTNITGAPWREEGTTHISVIGPKGDAVSATSTINYYFGSLLVSPSTGIILNNEMADFSTPDGPILDKLKPSSPNYVHPGKRPLSSMAPAIIVDKDGHARLVLGSAGGARITNVNAQVIARVLWLQQSLKEAIEAKRLHHQLFPNVLKWEPEYPQGVLDELEKYGHTLEARTSYMAVVQAVFRDPVTGYISAFSDPRKSAEARLLLLRNP